MEKQFGQRVRQSRRKAGLGLRELARRAGLSAAYLSKIERGLVPTPSQDKVDSLADALGDNNLRFVPFREHWDRMDPSWLERFLLFRGFDLKETDAGFLREEETDEFDRTIQALQEAIAMGLQHGEFEFNIRGKQKRNGDGALTLNLGRIHRFTIPRVEVEELAFLFGKGQRIPSRKSRPAVE